MRIEDLTVTLFAWRDLPKASYSINNPPVGDALLGLVTVRTDAGIEGHSFLGASFRSAIVDADGLVHLLRPLLIGEDPLDRERLHRLIMKRSRALPLRAIGAVDIALWDLAGKVAGMPIHRLLGTFRHKIPAYASSSSHPDVESYVREALAVRAAGYHAYKIHPPAGVALHAETARAVRSAVGPDYELLWDAAMAYSFAEAMSVGRVLEDCRFGWFEDPLGEEDISSYTKLCAKLDIPVMATEYSPGGFHSYAPWILLKATDMLRGDPAIKGGISAVIKAAHLADGFGMSYELHHGGNSINNIANLHLAVAIRNTRYFEVLLPTEAQRYAVLNDIEVDPDGFVHAMNGPGLGADIDFDLINSRIVRIIGQ